MYGCRLSIELCQKEASSDRLETLIKELRLIQNQIQDLSSHIATSDSAPKARFESTRFDVDGRLVKQLESWIDSYDKQLPRLTNFILPVLSW